MSGYKHITPIELVKESFYCSHCKFLLRDAVQNHEGYRLCRQCCDEIRQLPEAICNECGMSIPLGSEVYPDKAARREIASLEVYCPHKATGCEWTGKLSAVEEHAEQCPHKGVQCTNEGCEVVTTVAQLKEHMKNCLFRETHCPHCNCTLPFCALDSHYEGDCLNYPQPCERCNQLVTRKDLDEHLEKSCTVIKCKVCEIMVDRKTSKEMIDGEIREPHFSKSQIIFEHMQELTNKVELLANEQTTHNKEIEHLKKSSVPVTQLEALEKKVDRALVVMDTLQSAREDEGVISMKLLLQELQRTIMNQNKKIEGQAHDISRLTSQLETLTSSTASSVVAVTKGPSSSTRTHREEYVMSSGLSTRNELTSEPSSMDAKLMQMIKSIEELQKTTSMMKVHISELELQLQASLASTHTGSFLWRIPEVARRRRDAIDGRITSIYSPPFYSGRNGYKMCIRAYLNGDGIGFNTHLSVFFVLMRGEYDPLLKWPFESKVSLVLVDQNLRQHNVQTFKPSPDSSSFQRPRSDMNVASGCPQFAKLSVLDEGNYVKNDVLFLKCIIDTSKIIHP